MTTRQARSPAGVRSPAGGAPRDPVGTRGAARPALGVVMVVVAGTLFAINGTISKLVLRAGMDPLQLTALRAAGAFVGLIALTLAIDPRRLRFTRRELPVLLGYGLTGFGLVPVLYFISITRLPVGIALLFEYTSPLLVALWVRFGQRQQVRRRLWLGLGLSLAGLAAVAEIWGDLHLNPVGVAAGLGSAALLAVYYVMGARGAARRDPLSLTALSFGAVAALGAVLRPWWRFPVHLLHTTSGGVPVWLLCGYVVILGSITPYLLITAALRHLPPTSAGIIGMVEPVCAGAVAWFVLGEALTPVQLMGAALMLTGVILAETARMSTPAVLPELPPT